VNSERGMLILGFGGHARSVTDVAIAAGVTKFCFVDANARVNEVFLDFPVVKQWNGALPAGWEAFSASGDSVQRKQHCELIKASGWSLATLIAPSATIGVGSTIDEGTFIAQQAHVGPMATIGMGCIVNTGAVVEHETTIGNFTHVSVNATVAGRCRIGCLSMIGAGATVIDGVTVVDSVVVGAGAVVHQSIAFPGIYVGVPARRANP